VTQKTGVGIESIVGQQLPAFVGDQSDRVDDVLAATSLMK
jgi:hypothetical protein